jgi:hypothetical protein
VDATHAFAHGQPHATSIHAKADGRGIGIRVQHRITAFGIETDGMHARAEWQLERISAGESQFEVVHAARI